MLNLALAFIVGLLASGIVGVAVYLRQRRESKDMEAHIMEILLKMAPSPRSTKTIPLPWASEALAALRKLPPPPSAGIEQGQMADEEVPFRSDICLAHMRKTGASERPNLGARPEQSTYALRDGIDKIARDLQSAVGRSDFSKAQVDAQRYHAAARSANVRLMQSAARGLRHPDSLSASDIVELHSKIMPPRFPGAGQLRTESVMVETERFGNPFYYIGAPAPPAMQKLLEQLLARWNGAYASLERSSLNAKSDALADFYGEFLMTHPFADGNHRTAVALLAALAHAITGADPGLVVSKTDKDVLSRTWGAWLSGEREPLRAAILGLLREVLSCETAVGSCHLTTEQDNPADTEAPPPPA